MTGSSSPAIDAVVTLWNSRPTGDVPDPHAAAVAQLKADAALVQLLRDEKVRLEDTSGQRALLHPNRPDYVSQQLHRNLTDMLGAL